MKEVGSNVPVVEIPKNKKRYQSSERSSSRCLERIIYLQSLVELSYPAVIGKTHGFRRGLIWFSLRAAPDTQETLDSCSPPGPSSIVFFLDPCKSYLALAGSAGAAATVAVAAAATAAAAFDGAYCG